MLAASPILKFSQAAYMDYLSFFNLKRRRAVIFPSEHLMPLSFSHFSFQNNTPCKIVVVTLFVSSGPELIHEISVIVISKLAVYCPQQLPKSFTCHSFSPCKTYVASVPLRCHEGRNRCRLPETIHCLPPLFSYDLQFYQYACYNQQR